MRFRLSRRVQDPEKSSPAHESTPGSRLLSYILPTTEWLTFTDDKAQEDYRTQPEPDLKPPYTSAESRQASARLWSIYVGEADRYDKSLVESWKADMEGILIFSGLFSASLTAFLIESYRTLQPDNGNLAVQLLTQISQQLVAISNNASLTPPESIVFQTTRTSLLCNSLWFISLSLSIICALLATLVEQWAREFLHRTERRPSPVRRGRIFSFLYFGVRRFGMHAVVDVIPMLLHVSLMLFLAGLIAFLMPINRIMMELISVVLAVFLMLYAGLTLSPVLSLDSPFRTPFSHLVWKILKRGQTIIPATMNDAVVEMALQDTEIRDQRAFTWMLGSLIDDHEFLPFLEAIPEAIHGAKGFHLVNDYLFIPLLNGVTPDSRSLGDRITEIILRCRNLGVDHPMRQRGLLAGMKALWALAMISVSGRTGELFNHGERQWFDDAARDATYAPEDPFFDVKATDWPGSLSIAVSSAMTYSRANNMRNYIASLASKINDAADLDESVLADSITTTLKRSRRLIVADFPLGFQSNLDALRQWSNTVTPRNIPQLGKILRGMTHDAIWLEIHVTIVCSFLRGAAWAISRGGQLPHEYLQTCIKIVPLVPTTPHSSQIEHPTTFMPRPNAFDLGPQNFDPSCNGIPTPEITDLDRIMESFFRLLPVLRLEDAMPVFALYLSKRMHRRPIDFATTLCHLPDLLDCLVASLKFDFDSVNILLAVQVVLT